MTPYSPVWGYVRLAVDCIPCEGGGSFACDLFARAFPTEGRQAESVAYISITFLPVKS